MIFDKDINSDDSKKNKEFKKRIDEFVQNLEQLESKYEIENIFDKYLEEINQVFNNVKDNKKSLIEKYDKNIKKITEEELEKPINNAISKKLNDEIEDSMQKLDDELSIFKNELLSLFNIGLKNELKKGKYKADIDLIINFSFLEKLKFDICKLTGKDYTVIFGSLGAGATVLGFGIISLIIPGFNIIEVICGIIIGFFTALSIWLFSKFSDKEKMLEKK